MAKAYQGRVRTCAQPIELVHKPASNRAVVCLHGYMGYPGELALPAEVLFQAGFDVFVPRYPGHGTNQHDFMRTRREDWIQEAERILTRTQAQYQSVSLIGHSMGGAIAIILAHQYSVNKVVLYAPALIIHGLSLPMISLLSLFFRKKKIAWEPDPRFRFFDTRDSDDDAYLGSEYWSWLFPRQLRQLELIRREAISLLPETQSDILVFTGGLDTTVDSSVGTMVVELGSGQNNWIHLEKATHLIPYDIDDTTRNEAMNHTIQWLLT